MTSDIIMKKRKKEAERQTDELFIDSIVFFSLSLDKAIDNFSKKSITDYAILAILSLSLLPPGEMEIGRDLIHTSR